MYTESMIRWNEFYEALDKEQHELRERFCFCKDIRPIAEDVYKVELRGGELTEAKTIIINMILDKAAKNPELIFTNELDGYAYLIQYMVKKQRALPQKWLPLIEYLSDAGV